MIPNVATEPSRRTPAAYASGTGTTVLVFAYTVQFGDVDPTGIYILNDQDCMGSDLCVGSTSAISLGPGGAIMAMGTTTAANLALTNASRYILVYPGSFFLFAAQQPTPEGAARERMPLWIGGEPGPRAARDAKPVATKRSRRTTGGGRRVGSSVQSW